MPGHRKARLARAPRLHCSKWAGPQIAITEVHDCFVGDVQLAVVALDSEASIEAWQKCCEMQVIAPTT